LQKQALQFGPAGHAGLVENLGQVAARRPDGDAEPVGGGLPAVAFDDFKREGVASAGVRPNRSRKVSMRDRISVSGSEVSTIAAGRCAIGQGVAATAVSCRSGVTRTSSGNRTEAHRGITAAVATASAPIGHMAIG